MVKSKDCQFTSTMIRVDSLEAAGAFWTDVMGMVEIERSDYGMILEDPDSKQRVMLVTAGFGSKYALAIATDDMDGMLERLVRNGAEVQQPRKADFGAEYALCRGPFGISIMIYQTE